MRPRTTSSAVRLSLWFLAIFVLGAMVLHGGYQSLSRVQETARELGRVRIGMTVSDVRRLLGEPQQEGASLREINTFNYSPKPARMDGVKVLVYTRVWLRIYVFVDGSGRVVKVMQARTEGG